MKTHIIALIILTGIFRNDVVAVEAKSETSIRVVEKVSFVGKFTADEVGKMLPLREEAISISGLGRIHVTSAKLCFEAKLGEFDSYVTTGQVFSFGSDYKVRFLERDTLMAIARNEVMWLFYKKGSYSKDDKSALARVEAPHS